MLPLIFSSHRLADAVDGGDYISRGRHYASLSPQSLLLRFMPRRAEMMPLAEAPPQAVAYVLLSRDLSMCAHSII